MGLPCCCMSLQKGVIVLAIIDMVWGGIMVPVLGFSLYVLLTVDLDGLEDMGQDEKTIAILVFVLAIIVCSIQLVLGIYLWRGAKAKDQHVCCVWRFCAAILLMFTILTVNKQSFLGPGIPLKFYQIWVVTSFRSELLRAQNNGAQLGESSNAALESSSAPASEAPLPTTSTASQSETQMAITSG